MMVLQHSHHAEQRSTCRMRSSHSLDRIDTAFDGTQLVDAEKNPNLSLDALLEDFTGRAEDVWTRESINRRRLALAGLYVSCLPWFTVCVVAVVQAIQCLRSAKPKKEAKVTHRRARSAK